MQARWKVVAVLAACVGITGCCKDDSGATSEAPAPAACAKPEADAAASPEATATVRRTYVDAGRAFVPEAGAVFGAPPAIATDKKTATPPTTQPPPDTTAFGGPPPIATSKKTGSPPATQPPPTSTAFGAPPGLR